MDLQEVIIYGVSFDVIGKQPIVLLKTLEGNRFLPIWIGHPEAAAILIRLQNSELPRPMTHDLLGNVITACGANIAHITITQLKESTFYATLTLTKGEEEIVVDSRPSDALALAVRSDARIYAATSLIEENAIEFEHGVDDTEEIVDSFRDFLESVSPDDFANAEVAPALHDEDEDGDEGEDEGDEEDDEGDEDDERFLV